MEKINPISKTEDSYKLDISQYSSGSLNEVVNSHLKEIKICSQKLTYWAKEIF